MAKLLRDKPARGIFEGQLELLQGKLREKRKAELLVDSKEDHFTYKGITFTISDVHLEEERLVLTVEATREDQRLVVDNPLIFINPPIKVPDGTVHLEKDEQGNDKEVDNFVDSPGTALKEIVYHVVAVQNPEVRGDA